MHLVCHCSLPVWRRSFLKTGDPRDLFWPHPGSAPRRIWPKNNNTCKGPWVLHPYQVSSKSIQRFWRRSRKCEKLTDGRQRQMDGRGTVCYDNSSPEPSAPVSLKNCNLTINIGSEMNFHFIRYLWNELCVLYPRASGEGISNTRVS